MRARWRTIELADAGETGAVALLPDSKTEAGRRTRQVPDVIRPYLKALAEGKRPEEAIPLEHGASADVVASSLGHESISTTLQSYAKPEAGEGTNQRRVLTVLQGGELAS
jgi:hypothetical protein